MSVEAQAQKDAVALEQFECVACSRCGGSGHYSFCQMYGTRCFKCGGAKQVLTPRGRAAQDYFVKLCSVPASELKSGDRIKVDTITFGGTPYVAWADVVSVDPYDNSRDRSFVNGVEQPRRDDLLRVASRFVKGGASHHSSGVAPEDLVRKAQSVADKRSKWAEALAYQATLTKAGKPRKR